MDDQNDKSKQFINDLAAMIAEQTLSNIMDVDETVIEYVNKHLGQIIDVGLGIEKAWYNRSPNQYRLVETNGFIAPLKEFIQQLGTKYALKNAPEHVKALVDKRFEEMLEFGLGNEGQRIYADAYQHKMSQMCDELMKSSEAAFVKRLEGAVSEAMTRTNVLVSDRVVALIQSIREGTKK